jgi:hypothetical protein
MVSQWSIRYLFFSLVLCAVATTAIINPGILILGVFLNLIYVAAAIELRGIGGFWTRMYITTAIALALHHVSEIGGRLFLPSLLSDQLISSLELRVLLRTGNPSDVNMPTFFSAVEVGSALSVSAIFVFLDECLQAFLRKLRKKRSDQHGKRS